MSIFADILAPEERGEKTERYYGALWTLSKTSSGITVNEETALKFTAVMAACRLISETVGSLPLIVYKRTGDNSRDRLASQHWLSQLLHVSPNPRMSSMVFRESRQLNLCTWGNAYAEIIWTIGRQQILELRPEHPRDVTPKYRPNGIDVYYEVGKPGKKREIEAKDMLHVPGLGFNGLTGFSPIKMAQEAIGLGLAAEKFGAAFYGQGAHHSGVLQHPATMSEQAYDHVQKSFEEDYQGVENAHKPLILEEGIKWISQTIPPEEAQFIATRQFQITEVARIYNLPPHKLRDLTRSSFNNIEEESLDFVVTSMRPWFVRWEQELQRKIFNPLGMYDHYAEFLIAGLLRGSLKNRYDAYAVGRQWGWLCVDDIRRCENMNPLPNGQGQQYLVAVNMTTPDQIGSIGANKQPETDKAEAKRETLNGIYRSLLSDTINYVVRREVNAGRRAARKVGTNGGVSGFEAWIEQFYSKDAECLVNAVQGILRAYQDDCAMQGLDGHRDFKIDPLAASVSLKAQERLTSIVEQHQGDDLHEVLSAEFEDWQENKAADIAEQIITELNAEENVDARADTTES